MAISSVQALVARTMLRLSQRDVAEAIDLSDAALSRFENEVSVPPLPTIDKLQAFYEAAGIEFISGDGVRRRRNYIRDYAGADGFRAFMDDVFTTAREHGGDICLFNSRPRLWYDWLGEDWYAMHRQRMEDLGDHIRVRITVQPDDNRMILPSAEHRAIRGGRWQEKVFYVYGPKLAFLDFSRNDVHILVLEEETFADSFRLMFDSIWTHETVPVAATPEAR